MKRCKKYIIVFLTFILALSSFCACLDSGETEEEMISRYFTYNYAEKKDKVTKIDLIDYTPDATFWWKSEITQSLDFDFVAFDESKVEVKEILATEETDAFLCDLSAREFYCINPKNTISEINTPAGRSVRITYIDGTFDLISYGYFLTGAYDTRYEISAYTEFDMSGNIINISWIFDFDWHTLVAANYFDTKVVLIECNVEYIEEA